MIHYSLRPEYGKKEFLIEFIKGAEKENFVETLFNDLQPLGLIVENAVDLWINDEIILEVKSNLGYFLFSKDIWGIAFIMAKNNQKIIFKIDQILSNHSGYFKREVDIEDYF